MPQIIEIIIDGKNVGAIRAADGVITKFGQMDKSVTNSGSLIDKAFNTFFGSLERTVATATAGAAAGLGMLMKKAIDSGEEFNKLSQKVGFSIESLSTLKYATALADVEWENVILLLGRFNKTVFEAATGSETTASRFRMLGVSIKDAQGNIRPVEELLMDVADSFHDMPNGVQKTAISMELFGKAGKDIIPLLNEGSASIKKMQEEARSLGMEMSTGFARRAEEFNDDLKKMEFALQGIGINLAEQFIPALAGVSQALVETVKNNQGILTVTDLFGVALKSVATALGGVAVGAVVAGEALGTYWAVAAKIVTLQWGSIGETASQGFNQIKDTALTAGNVFDKLWASQAGYNTALDQMLKAQKDQNALEEQRKKVEALENSWKGVQNEILHENMKVGMSKFWQQENDLVYKANELKAKYYQIPGAVELINYNLAQQLNQLYMIGDAANKIQQGYQIPSLQSDISIRPQIDVSGLKSAEEIALGVTKNISDSALANFVLMQDGTSDIFGNMAGAAQSAFEASGESGTAFFEIYKAMSIAQASIDTYKSAVAAYEAMAGIPVVGPGLAVAAAAAATAFGLANVARIASMSPGSRGGGVSASTASAANTVRNYSSSNTTTTQAQNITLQINGDVLDIDQWMRKNSGAIKKLFKDGVVNLGNG